MYCRNSTNPRSASDPHAMRLRGSRLGGRLDLCADKPFSSTKTGTLSEEDGFFGCNTSGVSSNLLMVVFRLPDKFADMKRSGNTLKDDSRCSPNRPTSLFQ